MTTDEQKAYAKGYAAGQRRADREQIAQEARSAENAFWRQVFCASLTGTLMNGGWRRGEDRWRTASDYMEGCGNLADEALRQHGGRA